MNDQTGYEATIQMPEGVSTFSQLVDSLYYDIFWISLAIFFVVLASLVALALKFKRRHGVKARPPTGGTPALWVLGTIIPLALLGYIFHQGVGDFLTMSVPPANVIDVGVEATQWEWEFTYSSGREDPELTVPVNEPVRLTMTSVSRGDHPAVLHSFLAPALRVNRGIVPGHETSVWFEATQLGDYDIFCGEYCGVGPLEDGVTDAQIHDHGRPNARLGHSGHLSRLHVVSLEDYAAFDNMGIPDRFNGDHAAWGEEVFGESCGNCHIVDDSGTHTVGPNLFNVVGYDQPLVDGASHMADLEYMRESLTDPGAAVVREFTNVMPSFGSSFNEAKIDAVIEYLSTQSDHGTETIEQLSAGREE